MTEVNRPALTREVISHSLLLCGVLAPTIGLVSVGLSTLLASSTEFTWAGHALSDLGRPAASTFTLFNAGLIVAGLVALPFVVVLREWAQGYIDGLAILSYIITVLALIFVGIFHLPHGYHAPPAIVFFVGGPVTLWLFATSFILAGEIRFGLRSMWLGIASVLGWAVWMLYVALSGTTRWFAVPEAVSGLIFGIWVILVARKFRA